MAREKTIIELVQMRNRAERRVLRAARFYARFGAISNRELMELSTRLVKIDITLARAEREARRAVKKLVRKPRLVR